jgi:Flp pilus assembly protein TadD
MKDNSVLNNMGLAYQNINQFTEAEKCFNEVLKVDPKNEQALNNIGTLYKITGRIKESEVIFKQLAEEFP